MKFRICLFLPLFVALGCNYLPNEHNENWEDGSLKTVVTKGRFGADSLIVIKHYKKGELDSLKYFMLERFYSNGQIDRVSYFNSNGLIEGQSKSWYANGQISLIENYVNGKLHGDYESWLPDGSPCEKFKFRNGEVVE